RTNHRNTFSTSAALRWYTLGNNQDDALLKPPSPRFRNCSGGLSPGLTPPVAPGFPWQPSPFSDGLPPTMHPSEELEFVLRTQRASATAQPMTGFHTSGRMPDIEYVPEVHMPTAFSNNAIPNVEGSGGYNRPRRL